MVELSNMFESSSIHEARFMKQAREAGFMSVYTIKLARRDSFIK